MKFRKKPVVIEAEQFGGSTGQAERLGLFYFGYKHPGAGAGWYIKTLEGAMRVEVGAWVITGVAGEKYPCKDSIFKQTYEPA